MAVKSTEMEFGQRTDTEKWTGSEDLQGPGDLA